MTRAAGQKYSPAPAEPDAGIREEIARIERAILQGAIQILDEFGGLQAALKRSVALTKQARSAAQAAGRSTRPRLANGAPLRGALPVMTGAASHATTRSVQTTRGVDAHFGPARDARRCCRICADTALRLAPHAARPASAARAALTGDGSDPPVGGPGTGSGAVRVCTPAPALLGSLPSHRSLREGCQSRC